MEDRRCKLGLAGRLELVRLVEEGYSFRVAVGALGVAPATAYRWWHRWRAASESERACRACLVARRPVPGSCPWALSSEQERKILRAREKTNWGPMRLTYLTGSHRSTIWKGAFSQWLLAQTPLEPAPEHPPLRVGRGWSAAAHRCFPGPEVLSPGALGHRYAARASQDTPSRQERRDRDHR